MTEEKEIGIVRNVEEFGLIIKDINFGIKKSLIYGVCTDLFVRRRTFV